MVPDGEFSENSYSIHAIHRLIPSCALSDNGKALFPHLLAICLLFEQRYGVKRLRLLLVLSYKGGF